MWGQKKDATCRRHVVEDTGSVGTFPWWSFHSVHQLPSLFLQAPVRENSLECYYIHAPARARYESVFIASNTRHVGRRSVGLSRNVELYLTGLRPGLRPEKSLQLLTDLSRRPNLHGLVDNPVVKPKFSTGFRLIEFELTPLLLCQRTKRRHLTFVTETQQYTPNP